MSRNKDSINACSKRWRDKHPEQRREIQKSWCLRRRFVNVLITSRTISKKNGWVPCLDTADEIERRFTGYCEICGKSESSNARRLSLDHDHITGRFRFWLCANCNRGLGYFQDNPVLLEEAARKLREHGG